MYEFSKSLEKDVTLRSILCMIGRFTITCINSSLLFLNLLSFFILLTAKVFVLLLRTHFEYLVSKLAPFFIYLFIFFLIYTFFDLFDPLLKPSS